MTKRKPDEAPPMTSFRTRQSPRAGWNKSITDSEQPDDIVQAAALAIAIFEAIEADKVPDSIIATLRDDHATPLVTSLDTSTLGLMIDDVAEVAVETLS